MKVFQSPGGKTAQTHLKSLRKDHKTMPVFVRGMTHNLERPLRRRKRRAAGHAAIDRTVGGIGGLNEVHRLDRRHYRRYLRKLGLLWYRRGTNAIVWDPRVFEVHRTSRRRIMLGGYVGADGTKAGPDNRRVGPSRFNLKWEGAHKETGFPFMFNVTHKMAKSYTSEKWRLPLLLRSHVNLVDHIKESIEEYPNGAIVGDENSIPYVKYLGLNDRVIKTPPTHGPRRYDQVHVFGRVRADRVSEFHTPSDHDGLEWRFVFDVQ